MSIMLHVAVLQSSNFIMVIRCHCLFCHHLVNIWLRMGSKNYSDEKVLSVEHLEVLLILML